MNEVSGLLLIFIISLVVEGVIIIPLGLLYTYYLAKSLALERAALFSAFVRIPKPAVAQLTKISMRVDDSDDDDDDDDVVPVTNQVRLEGRLVLYG